MYDTKRLWWTLGIILPVSFGILGFMGKESYRVMPPVPDAYVTGDGEVSYTREHIERGRQVWQTTGGHPQGSIRGHGAYVAPDWSADWLHREAVALLGFLINPPLALYYMHGPNTTTLPALPAAARP